MAIKTRPVGTFNLKLVAVEPVKDNPDKYQLVFASEVLLTQGEKSTYMPIDMSEALGGTWRTKRTKEWVSQHKNILHIGHYFEVRAALDTYRLESGAMGTWYELVEMKPAQQQQKAA